MLNSIWINIIEANLEELTGLRRSLQGIDDSMEKLYVRILYHFIKNDISELQKVSEFVVNSKLPDDFKFTVKLRFMYKAMLLNDKMMDEFFIRVTAGKMTLCFKAESYFVLALAYQRSKNFKLAQECFEKASEAYDEVGSAKKSLRSWANSVAALSCEKPDSFLIPEYKYIYEKSFELEEWPTCVGALVNLSRELQRVGGMASALSRISEAEKIAEKFMYFSREHHLCLLQKAHIISSLGHLSERRDLMAILLKSPYAEVKDSFEVLNAKLKKEVLNLGQSVLPTWAERAENSDSEFENKFESNSLESVLIEVLS